MVVGAVRQDSSLIVDYIEDRTPTGVHCEKLYEYDMTAPHFECQAVCRFKAIGEPAEAKLAGGRHPQLGTRQIATGRGMNSTNQEDAVWES